MNVEKIGTEAAAQFLFWEYIHGILVAVCMGSQTYECEAAQFLFWE